MAEITKTNNGTLDVLYNKVVKDEQGIEPIVYEGKQVGIIGYANLKDRDTQLQMIQDAVETSNGIFEAMKKLSQIAQCVQNDIVPDEEIEVDGVKVVVSYSDKKTYVVTPTSTETLADLSSLNLPTIGKDALKELLTRETSRILSERKLAECEEGYDDYDDDDYCGMI